MNVLQLIGAFLKQHVSTILTILIAYEIFLIVFSLYSLPLEAVVYATLLATIFLALIGLIRFIRFINKHRQLEAQYHRVSFSDLELPSPEGLLEQHYHELIRLLDQQRNESMYEKDRIFQEMIDYYTTWAHQIKTPIAAMRLLLQGEQTERNDEMLEQLFRIELYVEMVLQYVRLENSNSDYVFNKHSLDDLIKQAVRKYAKIFIRKKIKLNYKDLYCEVLTDEKWFVFVLEQILSNALKYTNSGEISIYLSNDSPNTLVIEDTGIGIEAEDIPRVFEKGFTGYNGRADKKSTGIGLYLCKRILTKLSHTITIESTVGKGTKVKIGFDTMELNVE